MKLKHLLFLISACISSSYAQQFAEEPYAPRTSYGLFGGGQLNLHSGSFKGLPGIPNCCPEFKTGSGFGPYYGVFISFPLDAKLDMSLRIVNTTLSGKFTSEESEYFSTPTSGNGTGVWGTFNHTIDFEIQSMGLNAMVNYKMSDKFRLNGGFRVGTLLTKNYSQIEEISSPSNGVFKNEGTRYRNKNNGVMPNAASIEAALMAGVSYDFPLNSNYTMFLVPEANLGYSLTPYVSGLSWNTFTIAGGIGLRYAPREIIVPKPKLPPPPPPPPPPLPPPPPPPSVPTLDAVITAVSVDENGQESNVNKIKVEEFMTNRTHPLLNFVFFDEGAYTVPQRYKRLSASEKKSFNFREFSALSTIEVYYNLLNIVGKRLTSYPQAELTLIGCNSNQGEETNNSSLSQQRAEAVKDYLIKEWNIQESRIKILSRNLPEVPSNITDKDGIVENRRVEITSNVSKILEPIVVNDTTRISNPPTIRFKPTIRTVIGLKDWKIITSQKDKQLRVFEGKNEVPKQVDWQVEKEKEQNYMPKLDLPLQYRLQIIALDNKTWDSPKQTLNVNTVTIQRKIEEEIEDNEIFKLSMIGFSFNKAEIVGINEVIAKSAKSRVKKNSIVKIIGYSDRIGNDDLNRKLSEKRAQEVAKYLGVDFKNAIGKGEQDENYDNDSPEGRFYNRTVKIEIVTPLQ